MVSKGPFLCGRTRSSGGPLAALMLVLCSLLASVPIASDSQAMSTWKTAGADGFHGDGMVLENCILNGTGAGARVELDTTGDWWNLEPAQSPSAFGCFGLAAVATSNKLVLFGGVKEYWPGGPHGTVAETWVYDIDQNTWTQMFPATSPVRREWTAMATILGDDKVLMFGGFDPDIGNDTWIYDLGDNQWYQQTPPVSPSARYYHSLTPIEGSTEILLFGGYDGQVTYDDTWTFNTTSRLWVRRQPATHPPAMGGHTAASISGDDKVIVYGGWDSNPWVYDRSDDNWAEKKKPSGLEEIGYATMAPILGDDKMILLCNPPDAYIIDPKTWIHDLSENSWELRECFHPPSLFDAHGMATSYIDGTVINYVSQETCRYDFSALAKRGTYCSPILDTGGRSVLLSMCWTASTPANTRIYLQLRTGESLPDLSFNEFTGPGGLNYTVYNTTPVKDLGHITDRWVQYKAYLWSDDQRSTPALRSVAIAFDILPKAPGILEPPDGFWSNSSRPTFKWDFSDADSAAQGGFELLINARPDFQPPGYSSGYKASAETSYTLDFPIEEGRWFWKVRLQDGDGEWGAFSEPRSIGLDTTPPAGFTVIADPPSWTWGPWEVSWETSDNVSGLEGCSVSIDGVDRGLQLSPFSETGLADGAHEVVVTARDVAGNIARAATRIFLDREAPEPFSPRATPSEWTNGSAKISFNTRDLTSGIDRYEVRIGRGPFEIQPSPFILPALAEGDHFITVRAFDRAGNFQDGSVMVHVDRTRPANLLLSVTPADWTNMTPELSFLAEDAGGGVDRYEVSVGGGPFIARSSPYLLEGLAAGANLVTVRAYDRAGNSIEASILAKLDPTPPERLSVDIAPKGWCRTRPVVNFTSVDAISGIDHYKLSIDGNYFARAASPYYTGDLPDGRHAVTVRAYDRAGNFVEQSAELLMDRTKPVGVSVSLAGGKATARGRAVVLAVAALDNVSGPDSMCFSNDGASYSPWEPFNASKAWTLSGGAGSKTVSVKVRDRAGNEAGASATIEYAPVPAKNDPLPTVTWIVFFAAAVISGAFILRRTLKRRYRARNPEPPAPRNDSKSGAS